MNWMWNNVQMSWRKDRRSICAASVGRQLLERRRKKKCIFTTGNLFCIMPYKKPARNLAAYRVEFSLVGAHAPGIGNTDCTLGKEETKQILLILIRNVQSWSGEIMKAYVLFIVCPIDAVLHSILKKISFTTQLVFILFLVKICNINYQHKNKDAVHWNKWMCFYA